VENINSVNLTGNLTRDPELRSTPGGTSVCKMRIAVNGRRKDGQTGEWVDKPNYFDVTVWGSRGESCAKYLSKGRPVAIHGRLDWREWETKEGGKRQSVEVVGETVQFLYVKDGDGETASATDSQEESGQLAGVGASGGDEDIPF
jgi:single-strand DNA-binding protein